MVEYIVPIIVLILIVAIVLFQRTNRINAIIANAVIDILRSKESDIVCGLYNLFPQKIKDKVDSQTIAEIVDITIGIVEDIIRKK